MWPAYAACRHSLSTWPTPFSDLRVLVMDVLRRVP